MEIRNEEQLLQFLEKMKTEYLPDDIKAVEYLDSGFELKDRLQSFYNNKKSIGTALFVGLFEGVGSHHKRNNLYTFAGQLTTLHKFTEENQSDVLTKRRITREALQKVISKITEVQEDLQMEATPFMWKFSVYQSKFNPIYKPVNQNVLGYQLDFDFTIDTSGI